jgi:hypothetical protein
MNKSKPIHLEKQVATVSHGMDPRDARRQLTISLWLVGLLSLAMVAVLTARPQRSQHGAAGAISNPAKSIASGPVTVLTR